MFQLIFFYFFGINLRARIQKGIISALITQVEILFSLRENKVVKKLPNLIHGTPDNVLCHLHMISQICCSFSPFFSMSSYLLSSVCLAGHVVVFTELLFVTVAGGRVGGRVACLSGWWRSLWWNAGPGEQGGRSDAGGGRIGRCVAAQHRRGQRLHHS